jgi:hypothetical protein
MAEETRDPHWGEKVAFWTFVVTLVSAALFLAASVFFVLNAHTGGIPG